MCMSGDFLQAQAKMAHPRDREYTKFYNEYYVQKQDLLKQKKHEDATERQSSLSRSKSAPRVPRVGEIGWTANAGGPPSPTKCHKLSYGIGIQGAHTEVRPAPFSLAWPLSLGPQEASFLQLLHTISGEAEAQQGPACSGGRDPEGHVFVRPAHAHGASFAHPAPLPLAPPAEVKAPHHPCARPGIQRGHV